MSAEAGALAGLPPLVHVVGRRNAGKTALVEQVVSELSRRGVTVGTIKHTSHDHEPDTPGKDSQRHRLAGAAVSAIVTPRLVGAVLARAADAGGDAGEFYGRLAALYGGCALVIVEGHLLGPGPKVEVWRPEVGQGPLALCGHGSIRALVTDDVSASGALAARPELCIWPRGALADIVDGLLALAWAPRP